MTAVMQRRLVPRVLFKRKFFECVFDINGVKFNRTLSLGFPDVICNRLRHASEAVSVRWRGDSAFLRRSFSEELMTTLFKEEL